jgi:hypothetical protein
METLVVYRIRPEKISENRSLIEAVFEEIKVRHSPHLEYRVFASADGTFIHHHKRLSVDPESEMTSYRSFRKFRESLSSRCIDQPRVMEVEPVATYGPR